MLQGAKDSQQPSLSHTYTAATPLGRVDISNMMDSHQVNVQDLADSARLCTLHVIDVRLLPFSHVYRYFEMPTEPVR